MDTAGLPPLRELTGTDPLTLLGGHRALHEAADAAAGEDLGLTVAALVQLEELDTINRRDGYAAGDHALLIAARASQLAAARVGGTVFRASGRRFARAGHACSDRPEPRPGRRTAHGVRDRPARADRCRQPPAGRTGEDVIARARSTLTTAPLPDER